MGESGSEKFDHPYVPRDLKLEGYVPVFLSQSAIVGVFGVFSLLVFFLVWILSGIYLPAFLFFLHLFIVSLSQRTPCKSNHPINLVFLFAPDFSSVLLNPLPF